MTAVPRRNVLTYAVIAILALVATLFGMTNGRLLGVTPTANPTASPTATATPFVEPAPALFKSTDVQSISALLPPQAARATETIDGFFTDQPAGRTVDDPAFVTWASRQITLAPSANARRLERARRADLPRSEKRDESARWLGLHGCRGVWQSFATEQQEFRDAGAHVADDVELGRVLDLAAKVASASQRRFRNGDTVTIPAPCAPVQGPADKECGCTFPSSVAAMSAAARTYLSGTQARMGAQYRWMERHVDFAAVYQGRELPSDVEAGAYLGYLTGQYFLKSHGYAASKPTPSQPPP